MDTKKLFEAIKETAEEINEVNPELGFYALRKVAYLSEESSLESLIRTGKDIELIASKLETK